MEVSSIHMNHKTKACFDFIVFHKNYAKLTEIKKHITNTNLDRLERKTLMRQSTTIGLPKNYDNIIISNDCGIKNNIFLETIEEDFKEKNNDDFNRNKDSSTIRSSLKLDNNLNSDENNLMLNKSDVIPYYIFEGLHCVQFKEIDMKEKGKENKGQTLNILWDDFALYDNIID